ncbi:MAG: PH domain-containing protein [Actinomycetes bacterium]
MAYPPKLLGEGESIAFEMRPHWRSLIVPALVLIVTVAVAAFLLSTFDGSNIFSNTIGAVTWIAALVLIVGWTVRPFLNWFTTDYVFTNRRIIVRTGLIRRVGRDMPLSRVNNVTFDKTLTERILNCGTLSVQSAAEQGSLIIASVPDVEKMQREVYRLYEEDDQRRRSGGPGVPGDGS